jgi:hypothetical protein
MSPALPLLLALALGVIAWLAARSRAWAFRKEALATGKQLHSLPGYHGWYVALWAAVPAVLFALTWSSLSPGLVLAQVIADPAAASLPAFGIQRDSVLAEAQAVASGAAISTFQPQANALVEPFRAGNGAVWHDRHRCHPAARFCRRSVQLSETAARFYCAYAGGARCHAWPASGIAGRDPDHAGHHRLAGI